MLNGENGRTGVWHRAAVWRTGCSTVFRKQHHRWRLEPIANQTKENVRRAAQPANVCADGGGAIRGKRGRERGKTAVDLIIATVHGAHVEGMSALIALGLLPARVLFGAFSGPTGRIGFECGISN